MRSTNLNTFGSMSRSLLQIPSDLSRTATTKAGSTQTRPKGELSQSELDWAYAKRKLAMGVDPEEVIQAIAEYRPDKWNPEAYAKRTVEKALGRNPGGFFRGGEKSSGPLRPSPSRSEAWLFTPALARFLMDAIPVLPTDHHGQDLLQSLSLLEPANLLRHARVVPQMIAVILMGVASIRAVRLGPRGVQRFVCQLPPVLACSVGPAAKLMPGRKAVFHPVIPFALLQSGTSRRRDSGVVFLVLIPCSSS